MATLGLVLLTGWYAWQTRKTARAAEAAAGEAAKSTRAATQAADAAATTAHAAQRQADSLERDEIRRTMPVVHSFARSGFVDSVKPPVLNRVEAANLGSGSALNITLAVVVGQLAPGEVHRMHIPLEPGAKAPVGKLKVPMDNPPVDSIWIETRYEDAIGRQYASRTNLVGELKRYWVDGDGRLILLTTPEQPEPMLIQGHRGGPSPVARTASR